jgi:hypothetical protein
VFRPAVVVAVLVNESFVVCVHFSHPRAVLGGDGHAHFAFRALGRRVRATPQASAMRWKSAVSEPVHAKRTSTPLALTCAGPRP